MLSASDVPTSLNKNCFDAQRSLWLDLFFGNTLPKATIEMLINDWDKFVTTLNNNEDNPQYEKSITHFKNYYAKYFATDYIAATIQELKFQFTNLPIDKPNVNTVRGLIATEVYNRNRDEIINARIILIKQTNPFLQSLKKNVFDEVNKEIGRLESKYNFNDKRIPLLQGFYHFLSNRIDQILREELLNSYSEINYAPSQNKIHNAIKQKCKQETIRLIKHGLIENKQVTGHRIWCTRFAKMLTNAVMCTTGIPSLVKTMFHRSHTPCLQVESNTKKNVDEIYHLAQKL